MATYLSLALQGRLRLFLGLMSLMLSLTAMPVSAGEVDVEFDFPTVVSAAPVVVEDPMVPTGERMLVEARVLVSVRLVAGKPEDLEEIRVELVNPLGRMRVADFAPQTTLASEYADPITVATTNENFQGGGAKVGAGLAFPHLEVAGSVSPGVNYERHHKETRTETIKRVAPHKAVVVSGTLAGGHGLFFTFRRSPQDTLEGTHELVGRFTVPDGWRGDWLVVSCEAKTKSNSLVSRGLELAGRSKQIVGVYQAGDREFLDRCETLAQTQRRWLAVRDAAPSNVLASGLQFISRPLSSSRTNRDYPDWGMLAQSDLSGSIPELVERWVGGPAKTPSDRALADLMTAHLELESLAR